MTDKYFVVLKMEAMLADSRIQKMAACGIKVVKYWIILKALDLVHP